MKKYCLIVVCLCSLLLGCSQANKDVQSFFKEPQFETRSLAETAERGQGEDVAPACAVVLNPERVTLAGWTVVGVFRQDAEFLVIIFRRAEAGE